jgi:hypothetical protein
MAVGHTHDPPALPLLVAARRARLRLLPELLGAGQLHMPRAFYLPEVRAMIYHLYPVNDLKPHDTDGTTCHCDPEMELTPEGDMLIIHNSFDGRELIEEGEAILRELIL